MNFILYTLLVSIGINLVMFVPAFIFKTDKVTDISYAVTFAVVAISGYIRSEQTTLHKIILALVLLWSFRLGTFLFIRINKMKKDVRFDGMREHFFKFLQFWLLQGGTVFVVMLAASLGFMQKDTTVTLLTYAGIIIFVKGLAIEATADSQKFSFNGKLANKGKWIDVGIWRASRHPNYLGEMMVWIGMYFVVAPSLAAGNLLWALISPLYIIILLLFVSGVPLLEKSANKKWGSDPAFKKYKSEVPSVLPSLASVKRALR
jgi:steroid 5-alpha reductase family enzyme